VTAAQDEYLRIRQTVPAQERGKYDRQWTSIREGKEKEKNDVPGYLVDPLISGESNQRLKEFYPSDTTEAALRGANITDMLAFGDANIARSAQLQLSAYRKHVYARLQDAKARQGRRARCSAEVTSVTRQGPGLSTARTMPRASTSCFLAHPRGTPLAYRGFQYSRTQAVSPSSHRQAARPTAHRCTQQGSSTTSPTVRSG
jgi:hypothetical protein